MKRPKNIRDELVIWLRDAYSMERGLESMLGKRFGSDGVDSEVQKARIDHLARTRQHVRTIESLLNSLGSRTPIIESGFIMSAQVFFWRHCIVEWHILPADFIPLAGG